MKAVVCKHSNRTYFLFMKQIHIIEGFQHLMHICHEYQWN